MKGIPYFDTAESVAALAQELTSWIGTPFFKASRAKGHRGGVDCVHLIQEVYFNMGVIDMKHPMPNYPLDWAAHNGHSMLREYILSFHYDEFELMEAGAAKQPGDLLMINPRGNCIHHAGIMLDHDYFVHAVIRNGVTKLPLSGSGYGFKIEEVWRPVKK